MGLPDIVYVVRDGEANEELRHSLRSLVNVPHRRVWIAGFAPRWVRNVGVIRVPQIRGRTKYQNSTANLRAALKEPGLGEQCLLMNDDFFVLAKQPDPFPVYHRGLVCDVADYYASKASGMYLRGMNDTCRLLCRLGFENPISYELHVPLPFGKTKMLEALDIGAKLPVLHKRTLYGNLARLGGTRLRDVKLITAAQQVPRHWQYLSTMNTSWRGRAGTLIRSRFPKPGPYERGGVRR